MKIIKIENIKESQIEIVNNKRYAVVHTNRPYPCAECALNGEECGYFDCGKIDQCSCLKLIL